MLIEEIKKANIQAMKDRDADARSVYSIIIARYTEMKTSGSAKEIEDADVVNLIMKLDKELIEEGEGYKAAGREESVAQIERQRAALAKFKPTFMNEEEIKGIIDSLEDKSMPSIMKHFKLNYAGKVDMSLVSKVARGL